MADRWPAGSATQTSITTLSVRPEEPSGVCQGPPCSGTHPIDLNVVQLLFPLQDILHAVHPDVNVAHQHRLAHVLDQAAQGDVERLQELLDGSHILLVIQNCDGARRRHVNL